jgi:hypothetical protein
MLHKVYEYEGKHYCEEDISLTDPLYCGGVGPVLEVEACKDGTPVVTYWQKKP